MIVKVLSLCKIESIQFLKVTFHFPLGFPGGSEGKASAYNAGDLGSVPGSGRSLREGNGNHAVCQGANAILLK